MDRRVKERLVGASILAVLIVLVVPELLSGPAPVPATPRLPVRAPEPVRHVTVDLATSKAPELPAAPPDVTAASSAAASTATASSAPATASSMAAPNTPPPAAAPSAAATTSATVAAPLESPPPPPISAAAAVKPAAVGHAWAVQLGSFVSRDNADKLARQLKAQGFAVYVSPGGSGGSLRYRVRIGPMSDRGAAVQTVAKLKSLGQVASLVPPP